ncbi:MAG: sigma-70 family RNA polymerase sigma factor [Planctomycetes bacterium]|nr:sigma-70 family RNA polymerase sigma factor [Planctomycetota bacterium]
MDSASLHEDLVANSNALRRLARDLLRDPHRADDVVQDAMCAAIEQPPRSRATLGSWLRKVVARAAFDHRRGERRRRAREQVAAAATRANTQPTDAQVELQQRLLAAVHALAEPYRSAIWQRYYEDRSPREIAAACGDPVKTVKTRLHRGLRQLRERLDVQHGSRGVWATVAAPLLVPGSPLSGVLVMSTATKSGIAAAVAFVLSVSLWWVANDATPAIAPSAGNAEAPAVVASGPTGAEASTREPVAVDAAGAPTEPVQPAVQVGGGGPSKSPLAGIVLDLEGRPVAGIDLTWDDVPFVPPVRTDADGAFRCRAAASGRLGVASKDVIAVLVPTMWGDLFGTGAAEAALRLDLTIVVAPWARVQGVVVDTTGAPVAGAQLAVHHGVPLRSRIARVLDRCVDAKFETMTPDDGRFCLAAVPFAESARLTITARGHRTLTMTVEDARHREQFVLERIVRGDVLEGAVVDENGEVVRQAVIVLHDHAVVTEPDGTFRFELWRVNDLPKGEVPTLEVTAPERLPARVACLGGDWRTRGAWPSPLRVSVGGRTESIRGRVVRADGTPLADPWVSFVPPEPEQIRRTMFEAPFAFRAVAGSAPAANNGEFETPRVAPGRYRLRVVHPATLDVFCTGEIATGPAAVEIRMPDRGSWPALRGVVVDRRGAPVPGADWLFVRDDPTPGAREPLASAWQHATGEGVIEHPPVSRDVSTLCVKAAGMAEWVTTKLAELPRFDDVRIVVPVGCQTRIELGPNWRDVDVAHFVDGTGARSPVVFTNGDMAYGTRDIPLEDARSRAFQALNNCVALVLCRRGEEVARFPITLRPGEMNVLRW